MNLNRILAVRIRWAQEEEEVLALVRDYKIGLPKATLEPKHQRAAERLRSKRVLVKRYGARHKARFYLAEAGKETE